MSKEAFRDTKFNLKSLNLLVVVNGIINEYQGQGFRLTLRQLYYQLVSRSIIPNQDRAYKNLGALISKARLAGVVDWDAIEDRLRKPEKVTEWGSPAEIMQAVVDGYKLPRWNTQPTYCEMWVEKDALAGVLQPVTDDLHVTLMVNRGYSSQSAMKESAERWADEDNGREFKLFYIGDMDPSGEDMVRDVDDRLDELGRGLGVQVIKIGITEEQIAQYNPPPNPTKMSDSRALGYIAKFGHECWEADALPPDVLAALVRDSIEDEIDWSAWEAVTEAEDRDKKLLREASEWIMENREDAAATDGDE